MIRAWQRSKTALCYAVLFFIAIFLSIPALPQTAFSATKPVGTVQEEPFLLAPGDLIDIDVFEVEELTKTVRISSGGFVTLPLVGQVKVSGLTEREVEQMLEALLGQKYLHNPQISVFVQEGGYFYVHGDIGDRTEGQFPYMPGMTLQKAIAMAGGISDIGKGARVKITRKRKDGSLELITVNFNKIRKGKTIDIAIKRDDVVFVPRSFLKSMVRAFFFNLGVGQDGRHKVGVNPTPFIER